MAGQGMSVKIDVQAYISNLKEISKNMQDALESGVKGGSNSFKSLSKDLASINKQINLLSNKNPEGLFNSKSGLKSFETQYDNLITKLRTVATSMQAISIGDLNLNSADPAVQKLQDLQKEADRLRASLSNIGQEAFSNFLKDDITGLANQLKQLKVEPDTATFSDALKALQEEAKTLNKELKEAQSALAETDNSIKNTQRNSDNLLTQRKNNREQIKGIEERQAYLTGSSGSRLANGTYDGNQLNSLIRTAANAGFTTKQIESSLKGAKGAGDSQTAKNAVAQFYQQVLNRLKIQKIEIQELDKKAQDEILKLERELAALGKERQQNQSNVDNAKTNIETNQKQQQNVSSNAASYSAQATQEATDKLRENAAAQEAATNAARANADATSAGADADRRAAEEKNNFSNAIGGATDQLTNLEQRMSNLSYIKNAVTRWFGFYQVLNMTKNAVKTAINTIKELDSVMTEIAVVTNMTQNDLWAQMPTYSAMAMQYGTSIKGVYEISALYYQQGLSTNEVMAAATETLKMAKIANLDYATATDYMTVAVRGFKMEMADAQKVVDVYSAIAATTASSTEELAVAMSKTASSLESVGSSFENSTAMISTMIAVTREAPENIGTAMKSIVSRYGEMKSDPSKLIDSEGEALDYNKVDTALKSIGITIKDTAGQFRDFDDVIFELAGKWDTLDSTTKRYIATVMAGNRQQSRFLALVGNSDMLMENAATAADSENAALLQTLKTMESMESKLNQFHVALQEFYTSSGIENFIKGIIDLGTRIVTYLNKLPKLFGKIPVAALTIAASAIRIIKGLLSQTINSVISMWSTIQSQGQVSAYQAGYQQGRFFRLGLKDGEDSATNPAAAGANAPQETGFIANKWGNNGGLNGYGKVMGMASSIGMIGSIARVGGAALSAGANDGTVRAAGGGLLQVIGDGLSGAATGAKVGAIFGPVGAGIGAAIGGALTLAMTGSIGNFLDSLHEDLQERAERLKETAQEATNTSIKATGEYQTLEKQVKEWEKLRDARFDSEEALKSYNDTTDQLVNAYPEILKGYDAEGQAIVDTIELYNKLNEAKGVAVVTAKEAAEANYQSARAEYEAAYEGWQADKTSFELLPETHFSRANAKKFIKQNGNGFGDGHSNSANSPDLVEKWLTDNYSDFFDEEGRIITDENGNPLANMPTVEEILRKAQADTTLSNDDRNTLVADLESIIEKNTSNAQNDYKVISELLKNEVDGAWYYGADNVSFLSEASSFAHDLTNAIDSYFDNGELKGIAELMLSPDNEEAREAFRQWYEEHKEVFSETQQQVFDNILGTDWSLVQDEVLNGPIAEAMRQGARTAAEAALAANALGADSDSGHSLFAADSILTQSVGKFIEDAVINELGSVGIESFADGTTYGNILSEVESTIAGQYDALDESQKEAITEAGQNYANGTGVLMDYWQALGEAGIDVGEILQNANIPGAENIDFSNPTEVQQFLAEATGIYAQASRIANNANLHSKAPYITKDYLTNALVRVNTQVGQAFESNISSIIKGYQDASGNLTERGEALINSNLNILKLIADTEDADTKAGLSSIYKSTDLTSVDGLIRARQQILDAGLAEEGDAIIKYYDELISSIRYNFNTELQAYIDKITGQIKKIGDSLSKLSDGLDFDAALEAATMMGRSITDFQRVGDKWFITDPEMIKEYGEALYKPYEAQYKELQRRVKELDASQIYSQEEIDAGAEGFSREQIISELEDKKVEDTTLTSDFLAGLDDAQLVEYYKQYLNTTADTVQQMGQDVVEYYTNQAYIKAGSFASTTGVLSKTDGSEISEEDWQAVISAAQNGEKELIKALQDRGLTLTQEYWDLLIDNASASKTGAQADKYFQYMDDREIIDVRAIAEELGDTETLERLGELEGKYSNTANDYSQMLQEVYGLEKGSKLYNQKMAQYYAWEQERAKQGSIALYEAASTLDKLTNEQFGNLATELKKSTEELKTAGAVLNKDGTWDLTGIAQETLDEWYANADEETQAIYKDYLISRFGSMGNFLESAAKGTLSNSDAIEWQKILREKGYTINLSKYTIEIQNGLYMTRDARIALAGVIQSDAEAFENLGKTYADTSSAIEGASNGFSIDKAIEISRETGILLTDMTEREGKFYLHGKEQREAYYRSQMLLFKEEEQKALKTLENATLEEASLYYDSIGADVSLLTPDEILSNYKATQKNIIEKATEAQQKALAEQMQLWAVQDFDLSSLGGIAGAYQNEIYQAAARGEQELRSLLNSLGIQASEAVIDAIMDTANGTADEIMSMMLDSDVGAQINIASLVEGTAWEGVFSSTSFENTLDAFREKAAEVYGKGTKEYNNYMAQALTKYEAEPYKGRTAAKTLISNLNNMSYDTLAEIANAWGEDVEEMAEFLEMELNADGSYRVTNLSLVEELVGKYGAEVQADYVDFVNSQFSSINSYVSSALGGTLSATDSVDLLKLLQATGFDIDAKDFNAMFTQTANGLQMSKQAAYDLYIQMKDVNRLAAETMLSALVESAKQADKTLNDVYKVEEKIADLNDKIANAKPGSAREKQLKAELGIAQQIHKELLAAGDAYNFMDRDLPTGETNPISAWEGAASAMDVLTGDDFKSGYMQVEDFRNMIDFMGDEVLQSGQLFNENLQTADDLILAGYSCLKNVDGKQVVDLSALGAQFKMDADGMANGITDSIHQLAQSQIDILDAEIAMLETIVKTQEAFESIDADDSGDIDLSEFLPNFQVGSDGVITWKGQFTESENKMFEQMKQVLGEDFKISVPNAAGEMVTLTLKELSNPDTWNGMEEGVAQGFINFFNNYWDATENIDWSDLGNGDNLDQMINFINQVLAGQGQKLADGIDFDVLTDKIEIPEGADDDKIREILTQKLGLDKIEDLNLSEELIRKIKTDGKITPAEVFSALLSDGQIDYSQLMELIRGLFPEGQLPVVDMGFKINYTEDGQPVITGADGSEISPSEAAGQLQQYLTDTYGLEEGYTVEAEVDAEGKMTGEFSIKDENGNVTNVNDWIAQKEKEKAEEGSIHKEVEIGVTAALEGMQDADFTDATNSATDFATAIEGIKTKAAEALEGLKELFGFNGGSEGEGGATTETSGPATITEPIEATGTISKLTLDPTGATITFDPELAPIELDGATATATSVTVSTTATPQLEGFTNESGGLTFNLGDSVTGKTATLTITPTNYVTDISGATSEEITEDVKATASTATVAATSYTVTLTNQDGSTTSVVVDGTANLQAVINGLTQNAEGQYSLPDVTGEAKVDAEVLAAQTKIDGLFEKTYELNFTVNATTLEGSKGARDGLNGKKGFITNTASLKNILESSVDDIRGYLAVGSQVEENILTYWSNLLSELANGDYDMSNLEDDITTLQQLQDVLAMEGGQNTNLPLVENVEALKTSMEGLKDKNGVKNMQQVAMIAQQLMGMDLQSIATFMTSIADSANVIVTLDFSNFAGLHTTVESVASQIQTIVDSLTGLNGQTITVNVVQNTGGPTGGSTGGGKTGGGGKTVTTSTVSTPTLDTSGLATAVANAQTLLGNLSGAIGRLQDKSDAVGKTADAISKLKSKTVKVSVDAPKSVTVSASMTAKVSLTIPPGAAAVSTYSTSAGGNQSGTKVARQGSSSNAAPAKGNVAFAKGTFGRAMASGSKKTLMGELGPELMVSHGRYQLVGENGAEFVNLPNDAIVFNHLQTKDLLKNGHTSHGKPISSVRESIAFATGNVSGPAKASAQAALDELLKIRAMWQSLLDASMQDLGRKGGSGKGGGGGGGGGGGSGNDYWGVAHDLQRWYNLLRQIANEEQKITYEQAKRKNMNSGYDYSDSLQKELDLLKQQRAQYQELATLQKKYYDQRRKDLEDSEYAKVFTYNEEGLLQYTEGENRGLEMLSKLNETDKNGALVFKTAGEQIKKLASMGFDTSSLYINDDGSKIKKDEEGHQRAMQNFWARTDAWRDEIDGLWDEYHDHMIKVEENTSKIDEILQEYIDNQLSVEDKLLKAIEDQRQAEIDKLEDLKEATQNAADKYTEGLNKALQKEQEMYNRNQTDQETARLQRQLAILQRSGGSAAEIKNLQNQIDDAMKTSYFDAMQKQIDAIQEASDKEIERMETQIDLMNKSLEYEKENGLLWEQVYEMMNNWTPEKMLDFIETYTKEYAENSGLKNAEDSKATKKELEMWTADRDQKARDQEWEKYYSGTGSKYSDMVKEEFGEQAHEAFNNAYKENGGSASDTSVSAATAAADKILSDAQQAEDERNKQPEPEVTPVVEEPKNEGMIEYLGGKGQYYTYASSKTSKKGAIFHGNGKSPKVELLAEEGSRYQIRGKDGDGHSFDGVWISKKNSKGKALWKKYAEGGMVDYTGPAWVDGTKQKPEAFINAETTALLKDYVFSNKNNSLLSSIATIQETAANMRSALSSTGDNNTSIGDISITFETGTISNDYDARRAGQNAMEEILKIAKQSGNIGLSRR